MAIDMTIPKGDYGYYLNFTVTDSAGDAYNITDYTVTLKVWHGTKGSLMTGTCAPVVAASGTCRYLVVDGAFPTNGIYQAELELTATGVVQSTENFTLEVEQSY